MIRHLAQTLFLLAFALLVAEGVQGVMAWLADRRASGDPMNDPFWWSR